MGFFGNILGIGGSAYDKTQQLPSSGSSSLDESQGEIMSALQAYGDATSEYLSSGMDSYMPSTYDDLGGLTNTAMYNALSPQNVNGGNLNEYVSQLDQGVFDTDLTSPQSMADRARAASLFSGL